MITNDKIHEFGEYFETLANKSSLGIPIASDWALCIKKAKELNLPLPIFNDYDILEFDK